MLYYDGLIPEMLRGALGEYELSSINLPSRLVGYSRNSPVRKKEKMQYFIFKDLSASTLFVSRKQFSRDLKDLILYKNRTGWYLMDQTHVGGSAIVEDRTVGIIWLEMRHEDRMYRMNCDWLETQCRKNELRRWGFFSHLMLFIFIYILLNMCRRY